MPPAVVVLGSGYAGTGAVQRLESELGTNVDLTWISDVDHHLVLHEAHRCLRDPAVAEHVTIPVDDIASTSTNFVLDTVSQIDLDKRAIHLTKGEPVAYDYLLIGLGTQTAFFGINGLEDNAHTLKSVDDAIGIHDTVIATAEMASKNSPAQVIVGGAGLSGIQSAGELAELRKQMGLPLQISLVEGLDEILPGKSPELQDALRARLETRDVEIITGKFVSAVDNDTVYIGEVDELSYDVLVWTGGITGRTAIQRTDIDQDERTHRIDAGQDFRTNDDRVFAVGDAALIDQNGTDPVPPTAQAAWQAADVAGSNIARTIRNQSLKKWTFDDKGTVISVGESAVAHNISAIPLVDTFGGHPAVLLKKIIAAQWIKNVGGYSRALRAWPSM